MDWRRWIIGLIIGLGASAAGPVVAQPPVPGEPRSDQPHGPAIAPSREVINALSDARQALESEQFLQGVAVLQRVIDDPQDSFLTREQADSTQAEARKLLLGLPSAGVKAYETQFGAAAREQLQHALEIANRAQIAEVARRFPASQAGMEAAYYLATQALDQGLPFAAAKGLARLKQQPAAARWEPLLSIKLAIAQARCGQDAASAATLTEIRQRYPRSRIEIGGQARSLTELDTLKPLLGTAGPRFAAKLPTWPLYRGGATRNEIATEVTPLGGPTWQTPTIETLEIDLPADARIDPIADLLAIQQRVEADLLEEQKLSLPAVYPLVVDNRVIFRTLNGLMAVGLNDGQLRWRSVLTDVALSRVLQSAFHNVSSEETIAESPAYSFVRDRQYRHLLSGTISSDGRYVYAVELEGFHGNPPPSAPGFLRFGWAPTNYNRLVAYEVRGGKLAWEVGGPRLEKDQPLGGHFFLGPPLPLGGMLYGICEVSSEYRLIALESQPDRETAQLVWSQPLITVERSIELSPLRSLAGLSPAYAEGLLICPTAAGSIIAYDLDRRMFAWAYQYETTNPQSTVLRMIPTIDDEEHRWLDCGPTIAGDAVLVTPRDSTELHCLNLQDGSLRWHLPRQAGLYVACVHDGVVVVVGENQVQGLRVSDGTPAWREPLAIPAPSGRGLRQETGYLLPLSSGEILAFDPRTGAVLGRTTLAGERIPGNLAAARGRLVSVGPRYVLGFAAIEGMEEDVSRRLQNDPTDAEALATRGLFRLQRGDYAAGLSDLRDSLARRPDPAVRRQYAAALLDRYRADFLGYRDRAEELRALVDDPRTREEFHWITARGLEQIGELQAACQEYLRLAVAADDLDTLDRTVSGVQIRKDLLLGTRLQQLYRQAGEPLRQHLDQSFAETLSASAIDPTEPLTSRWKRYQQRLHIFGWHPLAHAIRRELLQVLIDEDERLPEQELLAVALTEAADPRVAIDGWTMLAALMLRRDQVEDALVCDRQIELLLAKHPAVRAAASQTDWQLPALVTRQTRTEASRQPVTSLAVWRQRFHALAVVHETETAASAWPAGGVDVVEGVRNGGFVAQGRQIPHAVDPSPFFADWSFGFESGQYAFVARNREGRSRWSISTLMMNRPDLSVDLRRAGQIFSSGHIVALSSGQHFFVYDALRESTPRSMWDGSLRPRGMRPRDLLPRPRLVAPDRRFSGGDAAGGGGRLLGIAGDRLYWIAHGRLSCASLATGDLLWSRTDIIPVASGGVTAECVLLLHQQTGDVQLFSADDGTPLGTVSIGIEPPLAVRGAHVLIQRGNSVELYAFPQQEPVFRLPVQGTALAAFADDQVALIVDSSGKLIWLDIPTHEVRTTLQLPPQAHLQDLVVQAFEDQLTVIVGQELTEPQVKFLTVGGAEGRPMHALAVGLDRHDAREKWRTSLGNTVIDLGQPANWPLLICISRTGFNQRDIRVAHVQVLDKRTGSIVYQNDRDANIREYSVELDPDGHQVRLLTPGRQVEFTFTGANAATP